MGRATIISGGTDGLYTVEQSFAMPGQQAEFDRLTARKATLATQIAAAQEALTLAQLEVQEATQTITAMIKDWKARMAAGNFADPDPVLPPDQNAGPDPVQPPDPDTDPDPPIDPGPVDDGHPDYAQNAQALVLAAHNSLRGGDGVAPFSHSAVLASSAQAHAAWMASNDTSSHTGANGSSPSARMWAAGYPSGAGTRVAENVAAGQVSVDEVMQGWLHSPGHKANIYDPLLTELGVGYAYRPQGLYRHYWVTNFGNPGA